MLKNDQNRKPICSDITRQIIWGNGLKSNKSGVSSQSFHRIYEKNNKTVEMQPFFFLFLIKKEYKT